MSRARRLGVAALLVLLLALVLEAVSFGLWWWTEGAPFTWSRAATQRDELLAEHRAEVAEELQREAEATPEGRVLADGGEFAEQMIHPFLGYVVDPDINQIPQRLSPGLAINNHGFYRRPHHLGEAPTLLGAPPEVARSDDLRIGVFGGSVAFIFSMAGQRYIGGMLQEAGAVDDPAAAHLVSYALGGYKQPQQLMALAWMLSLGERLDAVVNLDGFNDITLGAIENVPHNVHPYYPRSWRERVRAVPDLRLRNLLGEVAYLRKRRAELARRFAGTPFVATVTGNLVWRSLDRRAATAAAEAEARLAGYDTPRWWPAVSRGPDFQHRDRATLLEGSVRLWRRASRQMHDLCAARGIPYHHFLQPNQYVPGSKPLSARERALAYRADSLFRPLVEEGYPLLQQAGRELAAEGVAFHDLTALFSDVDDTLYVDDCCHLNPRGNRLLARAVAEVLAADPGLGRGGMAAPRDVRDRR